MVKNPPTNAGGTGSIPGWRRSSEEENGYLFHSRLGNPMARSLVGYKVHGVTKELDTTKQQRSSNKATTREAVIIYLCPEGLTDAAISVSGLNVTV